MTGAGLRGGALLVRLARRPPGAGAARPCAAALARFQAPPQSPRSHPVRWLSVTPPTAAQEQAAAARAPLDITDDNPLLLFFGSQTGTARGFAEMAADEARYRGIPCRVVDLRTFEWSMLTPPAATNRTVAFFLACYGAGAPTDNAVAFFDELLDDTRHPAQATPPPLAGLNFSVFGLGSKATHCDRFCVVGIQADARLATLGANRLLERVDGDDSDCIEMQFDDWQAELLTLLEERRGKGGGDDGDGDGDDVTGMGSTSGDYVTDEAPRDDAADAKTPTTPTPSLSTTIELVPVPGPTAHQLDPNKLLDSYLRPAGYLDATWVQAAVLAERELAPGAGTDRASLEVDIDRRHQPQLAYATGDHVVLHPQNAPDMVERVMRRLQLPPALVAAAASANVAPPDQPFTVRLSAGAQSTTSSVAPSDIALTLRQALTHVVDIQAVPSPKLCRSLAVLATDPTDAARLQDFAQPERFRSEIKDSPRMLVDLLEECPSVALPVARCFELVPRLAPRFYSISSSPAVDPDVVRLTCRVINFRTQHSGELRRGVCTAYLQRRPAEVLCKIWASYFKMPAEVEVPMVFVAGGTGIAPFKAFLDERLLLDPQRRSRIALFYGVRNRNELLYGDFLQHCQAEGLIRDLVVAFGEGEAGEGGGMLLSDSLAAHAGMVRELLQQGAHVYVCGGAVGFGSSIAAAFKDILGGEQPFQALMHGGRYLEDLS